MSRRRVAASGRRARQYKEAPEDPPRLPAASHASCLIQRSTEGIAAGFEPIPAENGIKRGFSFSTGRREAAITHADIGYLIEINFGMPFIAYDLPKLVGEAMATATDYRKWAEECFEWARAASDEAVSEQYASLGRVWLECAERAELRSSIINQPEPETAPKVA